MKNSTLAIRRLHATKNVPYIFFISLLSFFLENYAVVPPWLIVMLNTVFFGNCMVHPNTKKNKLDHFCIDCLSSFCSHCLPFHTCHNHVKIRRYVYKDVVNRHDLSKLFNYSGIQTYNTNKTKVLFLKQRNHQHQQQPQLLNSKDYCCIICDRNLHDNSLYCSIACKVVDLVGDKHWEEIKDEDHDFLTTPSPKRQSQKRSRKGIPIRAPML